MDNGIESAGTHLTIDAFVKDPSLFTEERLSDLFQELVKTLGMKVLVGPTFVEVPIDPDKLEQSRETGEFCDEGGITSYSVISKSHLSLHAWPLQSFFSMDVFSCASFDYRIALGIVSKHLRLESASICVLARKKHSKPVVEASYVT